MSAFDTTGLYVHSVVVPQYHSTTVQVLHIQTRMKPQLWLSGRVAGDINIGFPQQDCWPLSCSAAGTFGQILIDHHVDLYIFNTSFFIHGSMAELQKTSVEKILY